MNIYAKNKFEMYMLLSGKLTKKAIELEKENKTHNIPKGAEAGWEFLERNKSKINVFFEEETGSIESFETRI